MRIGYLIDTNKGTYDQVPPSREDASSALEAMIAEGVLAERAGLHSIPFKCQTVMVVQNPILDHP